MKTVIRVKELNGKFETWLKLSEVSLIAKILQDSPDTIFTVEIKQISKEYYNSLFA
jgi:hypothetical protein